MCFIFLLMLCNPIMYGSGFEKVSTVEQNKLTFYLKKINEHTRDSLDLRYKNFEIKDGSLFEKRNIVTDIQGLVDNIDQNTWRSVGSLSSFSSGIWTSWCLFSRFVLFKAITPEKFLPNTLMNVAQSILNFTGAAYIYGSTADKKNKEAKEFITSLFNDDRLKNKEFISREEIQNIQQKIAAKLEQVYGQKKSKKEILCKILPVIHASLSMGLSIFSMSNTSLKDDPIAYVANPLNIIGSGVALFSYVSSFIFCNNASDRIEKKCQRLKELLEDYTEYYENYAYCV